MSYETERKMLKTYTEKAEESILEYTCYDDFEDAAEDLNRPDLFRPFDKGLTELLQRAGYDGDDTVDSKSEYLYSKMRDAGSDITPKTVYSWFLGEHRPKIEPASRIKMYEICFALNLSMADTIWFFNHVYFDRCFNFHTVDEAVCYFCLNNSLTYNDARDFIKEINEDTLTPPSTYSVDNYTKFMSDSLRDSTNKEDFLLFMKEHKSNLDRWNQSAYRKISRYLCELTGSDKMTAQDIDKKIKRPLKRTLDSTSNIIRLNDVKKETFDDCGLLLREIYYDATNTSRDGTSITEYILEAIDGKSVMKNSFVLDRLICSTSGIPKNIDIPYIVKTNFPSKKSFSDVLSRDENGENKIETSKSYDIIRKILVLLNFYCFWLKKKLNENKSEAFTQDELWLIYKSEADSTLLECGYEPLFAGNPYDWIFLSASNTDEPLEFFRSFITELVEE